MPIFINKSSRVICQGVIDEREIFHIHQSLLYGTQIVAFVKSGFGGTEHIDLPVFNSVQEARQHTNSTVSIIMSPREIAAEAIIEAVAAGIELIVCLTKDIPCKDMVEVLQVIQRHKKSRLIGPGACGLIAPSECKVGLMPGYVFTKGTIGIVSTADTFGYEVAWRLTSGGFGQSTFVGLGNEILSGTKVVEVVSAFQDDLETKTIFLVLEREMVGFEELLSWLQTGRHKPVYAAVAGVSFPVSSEKDPLALPVTEGGIMVERLRSAGVQIVENVSMMGQQIYRKR